MKWLKEKMKNMSQGTEQLLFCIYCAVFIIILGLDIFEIFSLPFFLYFPVSLIFPIWISKRKLFQK
jgi:hypothetical protein